MEPLDQPPMIQSEFPPITPRGRSMIAVTLVSFFFSVGWTCLRVWGCRLRRVSPFMAEDILCYLAIVAHLATSINYILWVVVGGAGHHITELQPYQVERFSRMAFVCQIVYAFVLGFIKLSILRTFQRIFFTHKFMLATYVAVFITLAWMVQTIFLGLFICHPIQLNWDPRLRGSCGDQNAAFASVGSVDIVLDLYIFLLPIKPLRDLRIRRIEKISLVLIFSGGFLTLVVAAVRLYLMFVVDFDDLSYSAVTPAYLSIIQPAIAMMIACGPLMGSVFVRLRPAFRSRQISPPANSGSAQNDSSNLSGKSEAFGKRAGFDRIVDSQPSLALVELRPSYAHEAYVTANENPLAGVNLSPEGTASNGRITVTRQTVVSSFSVAENDDEALL